MNYLIIAVLTYVALRYIEPILDSVIVLIQTRIQINLQYDNLFLQSYAESFDVKESVIGYETGEDMDDMQCPEDCNNCPYTEECDYFGEFIDKSKNVNKRDNPTCKINNTPKCKMGFDTTVK